MVIVCLLLLTATLHAEGSKYIDSTHKFSLEIPGGWNLVRYAEGEDSILAVSPDENVNQADVLADIQIGDGNLDDLIEGEMKVDDFVAGIRASLKEEMSTLQWTHHSVRRPDNKERIVLQIVMEYRGVYGSELFNFYQVIHAEPGRFLIFTGMSIPREYERIRPAFEKCSSSLRLLKK